MPNEIVGNDWRLKEKVVAVLEKGIDTSAVVKRNVMLPVINSPGGRKRQCDVVVIAGEPPRQTITIVEVQKRSSKPSIETFGGWLIKKDEVGAQHLICVSEIGFPASVVEKAASLGPSIRLMTLGQLEENKLPYGTALLTQEMNYAYNRKLKDVQLVFKRNEATSQLAGFDMPAANDEVFRDLSGEPFSLKKLANRIFLESADQIDPEAFSDFQDVALEHIFTDEYGMEMLIDGVGWVELASVLFVLEIKIQTSQLVWRHEKYEQIEWGSIAWASVGHGTVEGKPVKVIIPITLAPDGSYILNNPRVIAPGEMILIRGGHKLLLQEYAD